LIAIREGRAEDADEGAAMMAAFEAELNAMAPD
jgi:hypothetical protein